MFIRKLNDALGTTSIVVTYDILHCRNGARQNAFVQRHIDRALQTSSTILMLKGNGARRMQ